MVNSIIRQITVIFLAIALIYLTVLSVILKFNLSDVDGWFTPLLSATFILTGGWMVIVFGILFIVAVMCGLWERFEEFREERKKRKIKLTVGIPTINRSDLLLPSLKEYKGSFPDDKIIVLDNGKQPELDPECWSRDWLVVNAGGSGSAMSRGQNIIIWRSDEKHCVAASWNLLIKYSRTVNEATHVLLLNDDVLVGLDSARVRDIILSHPGAGVIKCQAQYHWSVFIISYEAFNKLGAFDEGFKPAYFEDNDYAYRAKLAHVPVVEDERLNPVVYRRSASGDKDPSLLMGYMTNYNRYVQKWGGAPGKEIFFSPFG